MPEHVRMGPGDPYSRLFREPPQAPGGGVPVHASSAAVEQDRSGVAVGDGAVDGAPDCWRQRDQDNLAAVAADSQHPGAVFFAEVTDVSAGGFENPQASRPSMATGAKSCGLAEPRAAVSRASNCR